MTRSKSTYLAVVAVLLSPMAANADIINIDITVDGTIQTLDPGSDPAAGTSLNPGDILNLDIHAASDDYWEVLNSFSNGIQAAYFMLDGGLRTSNILTQLFLDGVLVDSLLQNNFGQSSVHFGLQQFPFVAGTQFDQMIVSLDFLSTTSSFTTIQEDSLRWNFFSSTDISYNVQSVPEPGTLALFGIGLFGMGLASRKKA